MTDEDTSNRMERANRIREMREGRRRTAEDDEDEAGDDAADGTADDAEGGTGETGADDPPAADDETAGPSPTIDETVDPNAESQAADAQEPNEAAETAGSKADGIDEGGDTNRGTGANADGDSDGSAGDDSAVETSGFEFEDAAGDDAEAHGNGETAGEKAATEEETAADEAAKRSTPESGVAASVDSADAAEAVDALSERGTFAIPDQATTVAEDDDQSMLNAEGTVAAARAAAAGRRATHASDRTRVLEFDLGAERFCLDIEYVEEIVELENMTRVPNSPSHVEGVVDLRGQVTAIINPKDALAVDDDGRGDLIVVFDSEEMDEQGHLGWVVDEVRQVTPVTDEEVNESPDGDDEHINGIINREDEDDFVVWTTPDLALDSTS